MRTTLDIDDALLSEAKRLAAASHRSVSAVVEEAMREALARRTSPHRSVKLPTYRGDGLQPGVDLDDSASLLDLMQERRAAL